MTDYRVLDEQSMTQILVRYRQACHQRKRYLEETCEHLTKREAMALKEFRRRQKDPTRAHNDLWTAWSNYRKKQTSGVTGRLVKQALRDFLEELQNGMCCYCQRPLVNIAHAKPIEHVLPRVDFIQYTFHFWNLAVACHDCNQLKREAVWANEDKRNVELYPRPAEFTEMYHPRFHRFADHVRFIRVQTNEHIISIYIGITAQGRHLCLNLLKKLAAREIVLNSNPELRQALEVINAHATARQDALPSALEAFQLALADSTSALIESAGA